MLSSLVIIIIYLAAVKNSESALIETDINSYIKHKLKDTKELLDKSYTALSIDHNKNITTAPRENFNEIVEKENWEEFFNKNLDPSILNLNDKVIFVKCVRKLENLLNHRMKMNVRLKKMHLERGNVGLASFEKRQSNNNAGSPIIVNPNVLKNLLVSSLADIAAKELAVSEKQIIFKNENGYILRGAVTLNGLVNFQEMSINNLSATYLMDKKAEDLLISETDQSFSTDLRNLKNRIKNLELNSICDLPFKYWLQNHDRSLNNIDLNSCTIYNDTIISVDSANGAYRLSEINVNKINGIDIKNLVNSSFLLGENQVIQGDLVSVNPVRAVELFAERINKVSSTKLLNKVNNDSVDEIGIDRLEVHHLLVDKINEVDVSDAARLSTKNVIKGKVRISNLLIRNELRVKDTIAVPLNNSMQVYEEVLIDGNVLVKNAQIEGEDCVAIALDPQASDRDKTNKQISSSQVLQHSWKKSEGQTIFQDVRFVKGASINQLECQRLNGLGEDDFVYSSADSLRIENVTFKNVHLTGQFSTDGNKSDGSFFKRPSPEFIVFDKSMRFDHLSVDSLVLDNYNGVEVNDIIHANNDSFVSDSPGDFEIFRATGLMLTQELYVNWLNGRSASTSFKKALRRDDNLKVHKLVGEKGTHEVSAIKMHNVKIKDLRGKSLEDGLLRQESLIKNSGEKKIALTVAGRLEVESNLNVINRRLNGEDIEHFIGRMKGLHLDDVVELKRIKGMEVLRDLNARRFLMEKLEDIFAEAMSLSSRQIVPSSKLIAEHAQINYLSSERLNEIMTSSLMHTDDILPSINGDKYFSSLVVQGNIKTKSLNDETPPTAEKLAEPLKISGSMLNNESVHVFGSVLWKDGSHSSTRQSESALQNLFRYAVLKTVDQVVDRPLDVEQPTTIDSLEISKKNSSLIVDNILDTLSDGLIDCDECEDSTSSSASIVTGKKVLRKEVKAKHAKVSSNIETESINHVHFDNTSLRLFRKSDNKMTLAELYFLGDLEIESLRTQNRSGEGISAHNFARTDEIMPGRLAFRHLIVERDISLFQLDNVVFNDFVTKRVKTSHSYDIFADVLFNQSVTVLNNSSIVLLNGIRDKHLVLKSALAPPAVSLIKGKKRFSSMLGIENNLDVTSLKSDFYESFVNADDTEIFGNLEIEDDVENLRDIILLGQLKNTGLELRSEPSIEKSRNILMKKAKAVNRLVAAGASPTDKLTGRFFYLERVNNFDLHWLGRVQSVTSTIIDQSHTRLDLYTSEVGTFCGLPIECPCRAHTLLEISSSGDQRVIRAKRPNVLFNFHEPTALFGLTVITEMDEVMQSCEHRTSAAKIFWTKLNANGDSQTENLAVRIEGFIAHSQVFLINNDKLYMVLAKFYDNTLRSHATDSLVYEFNLHSKTVSKCQTIATEGAKEVHIFQVAKAGVYALIGCIKGKAESLLLRFDPTTRQFQLVRTFTTGGSKHIASLSTENKSFVILSNPDIEAIQIYIYNAAYDNFYDYQNLYFQSRVSSLNTFYSEDFGQSKAYITITTKDGLFYIYQYTFSGKFKMKMSYWIEDFQVLSPFSIGNHKYLFATHRLNSTIFKLVQDNN